MFCIRYAGPEISVATTKAYSAQLAVAYLLAVQCAMVQGADRGGAVWGADGRASGASG